MALALTPALTLAPISKQQLQVLQRFSRSLQEKLSFFFIVTLFVRFRLAQTTLPGPVTKAVGLFCHRKMCLIHTGGPLYTLALYIPHAHRRARSIRTFTRYVQRHNKESDRLEVHHPPRRDDEKH